MNFKSFSNLVLYNYALIQELKINAVYIVPRKFRF